MKVYLAGNCYVNRLELHILQSNVNRLHSYAYQVENGKPVKDLKVAVDYRDGKEIDIKSYKGKKKPK